MEDILGEIFWMETIREVLKDVPEKELNSLSVGLDDLRKKLDK